MKSIHPSPLPTAPPRAPNGRTALSNRVLRASLVVFAIGVAIILTVLATQRESSLQHTITVNEVQTGREVALGVGDTLQVALQGNPSTGYSWSVDGLDSGILAPAGEPEFVPVSGALGADGAIIYRFSAVGAGRARLTMSYARPFEPGVPPLKRFTVDVVVDGA